MYQPNMPIFPNTPGAQLLEQAEVLEAEGLLTNQCTPQREQNLSYLGEAGPSSQF